MKQYHAVPATKVGRCAYEVWDPATRRLCLCKSSAEFSIKNSRGGHVAHLCSEHAEFFLDAHTIKEEMYE